MKLRSSLLCISLACFYASGSAWAFCSDQDAEAKGKQVAAKVKSITQSDPQTARKLNEQLASLKKSRSSNERPDDCAAYDQMLKELDQSAGKARQP
ncbi:MAG: hypothetical protein GAK45_01665 [Pseudomonas citronellolis]|nr:MAG: hypothetical protein GAK45_01665 [Pseudomonas citronellolis]